MKFMLKEPLTMERARGSFCRRNACRKCLLSRYNNGKDLFCSDFCEQYPQKAAEIMGLEVVDENQSTIKEKPLGEWTLQEAKGICRQKSCNTTLQEHKTCPFYGNHGECILSDFPRCWNLPPKPYFTEQDMEAAKAIKLLFPWAETVCAADNGGFAVTSRRRNETVWLKKGLFSFDGKPSVKLADILESEVSADEQKEN